MLLIMKKTTIRSVLFPYFFIVPVQTLKPLNCKWLDFKPVVIDWNDSLWEKGSQLVETNLGYLIITQELSSIRNLWLSLSSMLKIKKVALNILVSRTHAWVFDIWHKRVPLEKNCERIRIDIWMVHLTRLKAIIVVSMLIMLVAAEILYILGIVAVERLWVMTLYYLRTL